MPVKTSTFSLKTRGFTDIIDITAQVAEALQQAGINNGQITVAVGGSTAAITTIEYESGVLKDLKEALERMAPMNIPYHHDARWGDGNGYAHVRAAILGASLTVPFNSKSLLLGTWQQLVLIDFDNKPRTREVLVQIMGE